MTPSPPEMPARIDFVAAAPLGWNSGGSVYNERLIAALRGAGVTVHAYSLTGDWPEGSAADRERLASLLLGLAGDAGRVVIVDGLVGLGCPDEIAQAERGGVAVWLLVHVSLADLAVGTRSVAASEAARLAGLERAALEACSGAFAPSRFAAATLVARYGVEAVVAHPGVDRAPQARGSKPPHLVCVAALLPAKGQLVFLEALDGLLDLPWSASLVGSDQADRAYARAVRQAAASPQLSERVRLTGELRGPALDAAWDAADLSVLPSAHETFGMSVVESLAHGVPAFVPAGTGAEEALALSLSGGAGLAGAVGELRDVGVLRELLRTWLTDAEKRASFGAAARAARPALPTWADTAAAVAAGVGSARTPHD
ncbi:glycosyltransferase family 4 protein [Sinomonas terrae]|uniref:D-inositol 3-phosphate glycosyltransferase n=1 Tax=Sinomonas terrae TaxID=2908838 RepID=A0ABS9U4X5_9MICC|nr:glycosyltransferase family 4 protein [Sinomonas terrae]MCH6471710.1 glycosyltransferase family 4 protein [Sinomonas terrae]